MVPIYRYTRGLPRGLTADRQWPTCEHVNKQLLTLTNSVS